MKKKNKRKKKKKKKATPKECKLYEHIFVLLVVVVVMFVVVVVLVPEVQHEVVVRRAHEDVLDLLHRDAALEAAEAEAGTEHLGREVVDGILCDDDGCWGANRHAAASV